MSQDDLPALKAVIDSANLFPSEMLDEMTAGYFKGEPGEWLSYTDGDPVAIAYYAPEPMTEGTYNTLLLAVHAAHQGKGIGTALMKKIEQTLKAQRGRILLVETSGLEVFAQARKLGYQEEARIREFYAEGDDKIVFRKAL